jgi:uncharacterized protein
MTNTLEEFFRENPRVALGFSGGVDSSYLLYAGLASGADIRPYYMKTVFQPKFEYEDALNIGCKLGTEITVLELDVLSIDSVVTNPQDRCYHCKTALFGALQQQAVSDGYSVLIDGTNASDDIVDRPGMRALQEMSVRSPLRECGLTKDMIRELSRAAGLQNWNKPAYACLATRVTSGESISADKLTRVEGAENELMQMGYSDFRIRIFHGAARLQLPEGQMPRALQERTVILEKLAPYFQTVLFDLAGRTK